METTKLSSKGQVIIPKTLRITHHWETGLELMVIDTGDGILLKPKTPFPVTALTEVAGMLKNRVQPKTKQEIDAAVKRDLRRKRHAGN
ncbi:MAG: AbrB/MazE/SpoVT family DNA-binding domain-containing protein [Gammaproteobacteria bacterium]|nr:AbrB/MazE/SpoVT family DNA-binding domain-containing protein [Gammaproteobacteria bacterium]